MGEILQSELVPGSFSLISFWRKPRKNSIGKLKAIMAGELLSDLVFALGDQLPQLYEKLYNLILEFCVTAGPV